MTPKKLLVFCEDAPVLERLKEALGSYPACIHYCSELTDCLKNAGSDAYDAYLVRTLRASLKDPLGLFAWCQSQPQHRKTPYLVVGEDIEDKTVIVTHDHVRFVPLNWKPGQISDILDGLFLNEAEAAKKIFTPKFINPIVTAVADVLKTMAQIELRRGAPALLPKDSTQKTHGDLSGMISLNSDTFSGSLALVLQDKLALKIYQGMTLEEKSSIDDDVCDSVMEITNIVFGNARRDLNLIGHSLKSARPSIVVGKDHIVSHSSKGMRLTLPFSSEWGNLTLELMISFEQDLQNAA